MMDLVIQNGTVVTAVDTFVSDVGVTDGKIVLLGRDLPIPDGTERIDASGRYVLPGGVDIHTHLDLPGQGAHTVDDFLSGTIAAACGGTTSLVDFCFQEKGQRLLEAIDVWHAKAAGKATIDYGFHCCVVDLSPAVREELGLLPDLGVTSFKLFMAYKGQSMVDD